MVQEDPQALEKYSRADEAEIKELSLQIERLMADQAKARKQLDAEMTETHVNQTALDKVRSPAWLTTLPFRLALCMALLLLYRPQTYSRPSLPPLCLQVPFHSFPGRAASTRSAKSCGSRRLCRCSDVVTLSPNALKQDTTAAQ